MAGRAPRPSSPRAPCNATTSLLCCTTVFPQGTFPPGPDVPSPPSPSSALFLRHSPRGHCGLLWGGGKGGFRSLPASASVSLEQVAGLLRILRHLRSLCHLPSLEPEPPVPPKHPFPVFEPSVGHSCPLFTAPLHLSPAHSLTAPPSLSLEPLFSTPYLCLDCPPPWDTFRPW